MPFREATVITGALETHLMSLTKVHTLPSWDVDGMTHSLKCHPPSGRVWHHMHSESTRR